MKKGIYEAFEKMCVQFPGTQQKATLADHIGVFAIEFVRPDGRKYFFVSKSSMKGEIVSIHQRLLTAMKAYNRPLVMALGKQWYRFTAQDIQTSTSFVNVWHGVKMVNFPITAGQNVEKIGKGDLITVKTDPSDIFGHPVGKTLVEELGLEGVEMRVRKEVAHGTKVH